MSVDPSLVDQGNMDELARQIIAEVLMVPLDAVTPQARLVVDLGAESIDFLDLIFRLEEALGKKIPVQRWSEFVSERLGDQDPRFAITAAIVREFVERQARGINGSSTADGE